MDSGRIKAFAAIVGLFAAVVGIGAYAIVSLAPTVEYTLPPKGTFLQDPSQSIVSSLSPSNANEGATIPAPTSPSGRRGGAETAAKPAGSSQDAAQGTAPSGMAEDRSTQNLEPRRSQRVSVAPAAPAVLPNPLRAPTAHATPPLRPIGPQPANVLTPAEILRLKRSLRLTPEQEQYWPPVEAVLSDIGAQQMILARSGQNTADAFSNQTSMRIYFAAKPLLGLMREDQKAQIRVRARAMGLDSVAAYL